MVNGAENGAFPRLIRGSTLVHYNKGVPARKFLVKPRTVHEAERMSVGYIQRGTENPHCPATSDG